jgi:hypothetical protein
LEVGWDTEKAFIEITWNVGVMGSWEVKCVVYSVVTVWNLKESDENFMW